MSIEVPASFADEELALVDELVADGVGNSRSETIRVAVARLHDQHRRTKVGALIADSYRKQPQSAEDDAWAIANAVALTEAEPW